MEPPWGGACPEYGRGVWGPLWGQAPTNQTAACSPSRDGPFNYSRLSEASLLPPSTENEPARRRSPKPYPLSGEGVKIDPPRGPRQVLGP
eukprot:CAMPEP_0180207604 /NCGR_PEP_ID=MMETSP0987-20121128/10253_1 /TAXON_ID=697907 /ORGANISM="non described non described, Strain CCMP2293" /LENGTH=89 /DNA_ID=CAMNT_0022163611 /DNA_START=360 /DNA_END=626 /DNA_ORIENTATION=-